MENKEFEILATVPINKKLIHLGVIDATLSELENFFGPALDVDDTDLVNKRWIIQWADTAVADICDWKSEKHDIVDPNEKITWHVAGTVQSAYTDLVSYIAK